MKYTKHLFSKHMKVETYRKHKEKMYMVLVFMYFREIVVKSLIEASQTSAAKHK